MVSCSLGSLMAVSWHRAVEGESLGLVTDIGVDAARVTERRVCPRRQGEACPRGLAVT